MNNILSSQSADSNPRSKSYSQHDFNRALFIVGALAHDDFLKLSIDQYNPDETLFAAVQLIATILASWEVEDGNYRPMPFRY